MTKVLFKRKTSDEIANLPVEDGAIIYNHETGATYLDYGNERIPTGGGMPTGDTFPIGAITSYAGDTAPVNWLICDGRAISRTTYADLFDAIGTTYGVGDGSTTFNLPNLKGRVITGLDSSQTEFDTLGETGGEKTHTLTINEMPSHKHEDLNWTADSYHLSINEGSTGGVKLDYTGNNIQHVEGGFRTGYTGGGEAHNILQPYITLNYIIKAFQSSGTVANVSRIETNSDTDTYSCNYINNMDRYSTDEVKTNKVWIDNRTIYRKVLLGKLPTGEGENSFNFSNINIIDFNGTIEANSGAKFKINTYYSPYPNYSISGFISSTGDSLKIECGSNYNTNSSYEIVIEYTKTLD